jgi:hypothetical protein
MANMEKELTDHTVILQEQSGALSQVLNLLNGIKSVTSSTNDTVRENGGNTHSISDVVTRIAQKMEVFETPSVQPDIPEHRDEDGPVTTT